jgi:colanic acid biosynthesis glycosyl transferase WcaI
VRILHHSLNYPPDGNSTAWLEGELGAGLQALGHGVVALTATPSANYDPESRAKQPFSRTMFGLAHTSDFKGVRIIHVSIPEKKNKVVSRVIDYLRFAALSLVAGVIKTPGADVVLTISPPLTIGLSGWILARIKRASHVYVVQEIYPDVAVSIGVLRNRRVIALMEQLEMFIYRRSTYIVVISEWFRGRLIEKGVPEAKIVVIPNFVDVDFFRPLPRNNSFSEAHCLDDKFVVFYGGNIGLTQSWNCVLDAAGQLRDITDLRIVITGGGGRYTWLADKLATGEHPNVILLPYQPRSVVPEMYASCDVGLIPMMAGTARETFPSKIYTIMASERPAIVATDADTELGWIVSHAKCGWAVPPDDASALAAAIRQAFDQRALLKELGKNGRRYVTEHNAIQTVVRQYDEFLGQLVKPVSP